MKELIKITESNGQRAVSARELYLYLSDGDNSNVNAWISRNIINNEYADEHVDYEIIRYYNESGREMINYALSIDFSKELCMLSQCENGKQARQYFIECEKQLKEVKKPMSQIELIIHSAQLLQAQEMRLNAIEDKVKAIESMPVVNAPMEHFSIMGHCRNIKKQIDIKQATAYGIKCKKMCRDLGSVIGSVPDPRFGTVNTYPLDVLTNIIG